MRETRAHTDRDTNGSTVSASFQRLLDSGQQLVEHRLELLRVDTRMRLLDSSHQALVVGLGAAVLALGWIGLMCALVLALRPWAPVATLIAIIGGAHVVIGGAVLAWGLHGLRRTERRPSDG